MRELVRVGQAHGVFPALRGRLIHALDLGANVEADVLLEILHWHDAAVVLHANAAIRHGGNVIHALHEECRHVRAKPGNAEARVIGAE